MAEYIALYADTEGGSPFVHRVVLGLEEVGAKYTKYEIDYTKNKPDWFVEKVNPVGKVPAIAYGGPDVPADQPSFESIKIAESLVIVEFLADVYPNSSLLPTDPVLRAKARYFVEVSKSLFQPWFAFITGSDGSPSDIIKALEDIQTLLPPESKYAIGDDFTLADVAFGPELARLDIMTRNHIGVFGESNGLELVETLRTPAFTRLWKYLEDIKAQESFKKTFNEAEITQKYLTRFSGRN